MSRVSKEKTDNWPAWGRVSKFGTCVRPLESLDRVAMGRTQVGWPGWAGRQVCWTLLISSLAYCYNSYFFSFFLFSFIDYVFFSFFLFLLSIFRYSLISLHLSFDGVAFSHWISFFFSFSFSFSFRNKQTIKLKHTHAHA